MKHYLYILFFSIYYTSFAQTDLVLIKGIVHSDLNDERVENAIVHIKVSDGNMFEAKTNEQGEYSFKIKNDTSLRFLISVATNYGTKSKNSKDYRFLASEDSKNPEKIEYGKDFIKDFKLTTNTHNGMSFPKILFKQNSIKPYNNYLYTLNPKEYDSFENAINFIYGMLESNPTIVIEIAGHASAHEKKSEKLSLNRAEFIKNTLVSKGVNANRIYTKGYGNTIKLVTDEMINEAQNAKTKEEKEALHLKNQRVVFRIISWDYTEEKK